MSQKVHPGRWWLQHLTNYLINVFKGNGCTDQDTLDFDDAIEAFAHVLVNLYDVANETERDLIMTTFVKEIKDWEDSKESWLRYVKFLEEAHTDFAESFKNRWPEPQT